MTISNGVSNTGTIKNSSSGGMTFTTANVTNASGGTISVGTGTLTVTAITLSNSGTVTVAVPAPSRAPVRL